MLGVMLTIALGFFLMVKSSYRSAERKLARQAALGDSGGMETEPRLERPSFGEGESSSATSR